MQDFITAVDLAKQLHIDPDKLYGLAARESDPLPIMYLPNAKRGAFVIADDAKDWCRRNGIPYAEMDGKVR